MACYVFCGTLNFTTTAATVKCWLSDIFIFIYLFIYIGVEH